jgi:addiction module RelE/StbE family toxin
MLLLTEAARDDLRAIYTYYADRTPAGADRVVGTILKAANGLLRFPLLGKPGVVEGTRERLVTRFPYRIIYRIEEDDIIVLRVIHTARQ